MVDVEIKRGYEVLSDNNVRFGIRVINNSSFAIMDVEVILDYSEDSFKLQGDRIYKFGTIPPSVHRTAKFVLQPKGCIHKDELGATVLYKDHEWNKYVEQMRPFLEEKSISRAEFLALSKSGYSAESGVNFDNIDSAKVVDFLSHTCKNRLYKVDEFPVEDGSIIYMAGDAVGEKAYYLLTAVVKEHEGLTQVFLRANSDKNHGLTGFLNETLYNLRHLVVAGKVREIGVIKKEQVINIINSVVQRTSFGEGKGGASVNIQDSVVQRTEFNSGEDRRVEEEQEKQTTSEGQKRMAKKKSKTRTNMFMLAIVLGALLGGFVMFAPSSNPKTITNSIDMDFVLIPAGAFDMGSPSDERGRFSDEEPVHHVKIKNEFYMGKYEVTQKHWRKVMENNPLYYEEDDWPVEAVSWNDAQDFIKKLNEKEGTNKYRLPSEAEWEYAARAGTTTRYSFGDDESRLGEYGWHEGWTDDNLGTHPVGQKKPNPWGLYDMHGNVFEWVQDKYHENYNGAPSDGSAWESGGRSYRVLRGGSWSIQSRLCRSAYRSNLDPDYRDSYGLGFRLLLET